MRSGGGLLVSLTYLEALRPYRWIIHCSVWYKASVMPDLRLPSQLQVPIYTAWWQRHLCVNNPLKVVTWQLNGQVSNLRPFKPQANIVTIMQRRQHMTEVEVYMMMMMMMMMNVCGWHAEHEVGWSARTTWRVGETDEWNGENMGGQAQRNWKNSHGYFSHLSRLLEYYCIFLLDSSWDSNCMVMF